MNNLVKIDVIDKEHFKLFTATGKQFDATIEGLEDDTILVFSYKYYYDKNIVYNTLYYDYSIDDKLEDAVKNSSVKFEDIIELAIQKSAGKNKIKMIMKLKEETGAGVIDCKRALTKTDWIIEKAKQYLKEHPMRIGI